MKRANYLILFIVLALVSASCKKQPTAQTPAGESKEAPAAQIEKACELVTESDVEALFGHPVMLEEDETSFQEGVAPTCRFEAKDESTALEDTTYHGDFSVRPYSDQVYGDSQTSKDGEAVSGYGDKAHIYDAGTGAEIGSFRFLAKKGSQILELDVKATAGAGDLSKETMREKTLALAEKILANI